MPLKRKIITVGNSKAITLPSEWLDYHEAKRGSPLETILMEINDNITLKIEVEEDHEPSTESAVP